ncbi:hypothetical protein F4804DRAFT_350271 [Jackrogersella minutella]|nr:hypothetical protein F4804DRAFT_350271 [Jackrogersella minutella]
MPPKKTVDNYREIKPIIGLEKIYGDNSDYMDSAPRNRARYNGWDIEDMRRRQQRREQLLKEEAQQANEPVQAQKEVKQQIEKEPLPLPSANQQVSEPVQPQKKVKQRTKPKPLLLPSPETSKKAPTAKNPTRERQQSPKRPKSSIGPRRKVLRPRTEEEKTRRREAKRREKTRQRPQEEKKKILKKKRPTTPQEERARSPPPQEQSLLSPSLTLKNDDRSQPPAPNNLDRILSSLLVTLNDLPFLAYHILVEIINRLDGRDQLQLALLRPQEFLSPLRVNMLGRNPEFFLSNAQHIRGIVEEIQFPDERYGESIRASVPLVVENLASTGRVDLDDLVRHLVRLAPIDAPLISRIGAENAYGASVVLDEVIAHVRSQLLDEQMADQAGEHLLRQLADLPQVNLAWTQALFSRARGHVLVAGRLLLVAIRGASPDAVQWLVKHNCPVTLQALFAAIARGDRPLIEALTRTMPPRQGGFPAVFPPDFAPSEDDLELAFRDVASTPRIFDAWASVGFSPLDVALVTRDIGLAVVLIDNGADPARTHVEVRARMLAGLRDLQELHVDDLRDPSLPILDSIPRDCQNLLPWIDDAMSLWLATAPLILGQEMNNVIDAETLSWFENLFGHY